MNAMVGHLPFRADYRVTGFPDEPVQGQPTNLGYVRQDFSATCPFWQDSVDEWSLTANVRSELFDTHAILPDTGQRFPDELWSIRLGTTYRHAFDNGWIGGGTVSVGSPSNKPFQQLNVITAGIHWSRAPREERRLALFLELLPTSEIPFPIPLVAYIWQPSDQFRAHIGLPFQLWYRPFDDLTLDFSCLLLRTVHARATYRITAPVRVYVGFDWENEATSWPTVHRRETVSSITTSESRVGSGPTGTPTVNSAVRLRPLLLRGAEFQRPKLQPDRRGQRPVPWSRSPGPMVTDGLGREFEIQVQSGVAFRGWQSTVEVISFLKPPVTRTCHGGPG